MLSMDMDASIESYRKVKVLKNGNNDTPMDKRTGI